MQPSWVRTVATMISVQLFGCWCGLSQDRTVLKPAMTARLKTGGLHLTAVNCCRIGAGTWYWALSRFRAPHRTWWWCRARWLSMDWMN